MWLPGHVIGRVGERPGNPGKNYWQANSWTVAREWQEMAIESPRIGYDWNADRYIPICYQCITAEVWWVSWDGCASESVDIQLLWPLSLCCRFLISAGLLLSTARPQASLHVIGDSLKIYPFHIKCRNILLQFLAVFYIHKCKCSKKIPFKKDVDIFWNSLTC